MNKIISILKLSLEDSYNKNNKKNYSVKVIIIMGLLLFFALSFLFNFTIYISFKAFETYIYIYPLLIAISAFMLTFFTTIYKTKSYFFAEKDKTNLGTLPIKRSEIIGAKFILAYLEELVFTLIVFLPCLILYSTTDLSFIFFGFVLMLTIPMISLLTAFFIGFILQLLVARFNFLKYFGTILYLGFIVLCCMTSTITNNMDETNILPLLNIVNYFPFNIIYKGFICHDILYFSLFIIVSIIALALLITLYSLFYDKYFNALDYVRKKKDFKNEDIKTNNVTFSIIKMDLKRLVSEQMFFLSAILPGLLGGLLTLIFSLTFNSQMKNSPGMSEEEMNVLLDVMNNIYPFLMFFFLSMSSYTAIAITFEGKNFYIIKTLPIKAKTYLNIKILEQIMLNGISVLIFSIIIIIVNKYNLAMAIFILLAPQLFVIFIGAFGLLINLKYPKLVWSNYQQIKNSKSVLITALFGMLIGIVVSGAGIGLIFINLYISLATISSIIVILTIISLVLVYKFGPKLLKEIEA